jgi:hypothetical protein
MPKKQEGKRSGRSPQRSGKEKSTADREEQSRMVSKCGICGAEFSDTGLLAEHTKIHDKEHGGPEESADPGVIEVPVGELP